LVFEWAKVLRCGWDFRGGGRFVECQLGLLTAGLVSLGNGGAEAAGAAFAAAS
jgi:hypothetical protein